MWLRGGVEGDRKGVKLSSEWSEWSTAESCWLLVLLATPLAWLGKVGAPWTPSRKWDWMTWALTHVSRMPLTSNPSTPMSKTSNMYLFCFSITFSIPSSPANCVFSFRQQLYVRSPFRAKLRDLDYTIYTWELVKLEWRVGQTTQRMKKLKENKWKTKSWKNKREKLFYLLL